MAKKQGICKNLDGGCSLAENKIVQEVESTQFVCEECGAELYELPNKGSKKKSGGKKKTLIPIIAAAVVILLCVGAFLLFGGKDKGTDKVQEPVDTTVAVASVSVDPEEISVKVSEETDVTASVLPENATDKSVVWESTDEAVATVDENGHIVAKKAGKTEITATAGGVSAICAVTVEAKPQTTTGGNTYKFAWGVYEGPMKNGVPHGIQGEVKVTDYYSIDLKKTPAQFEQVKPGDKIVNCKFENGRLVYGMLKRTNGEQVALNIGS